MTAEEIVRAELDADPLGRGYSGMTDNEVSDDLNTVYRDLWVPVTGSDILEVISAGALSGLTAAKRDDVDTVVSMGGVIDLSPGSRADVMLTTAFAGKPATLTALANVAKRTTSRAQELDCGVTPTIVAAARALE